MRRTLISGTGRCGTAAIAKVLTEVGVPCSHETIYGVTGQRPKLWKKFHAESSWMAAPHVQDFVGTVVLLFREPRRCISSLLGSGIFSAGDGDYRKVIESRGYGTGTDEATRYYIETNCTVSQRADLWIDLSDLSVVLPRNTVEKWRSHNHRACYPILKSVSPQADRCYQALRKHRFRGDLLAYL